MYILQVIVLKVAIFFHFISVRTSMWGLTYMGFSMANDNIDTDVDKAKWLMANIMLHYIEFKIDGRI